MRKTATIDIEGLRTVQIKELRVKDIRNLFARGDDITPDKLLDEALPLCTDLTRDELDDLAPSELMQVWEVVKSVNEVLLKKIEQAGILAVIKVTFAKTLKTLFASLSSEATQTPPSTESVSS